MKYILIISLLMLIGCKTERINRQLRLSKKHLARAIELGAKLDSTKTQVKSTGEVEGITDKESTTAKVDTVAVTALLNDFIFHDQKEHDGLIRLKTDTVHSHIISMTTSGIIRSGTIPKLQKAICPDDSIRKIIPIDFKISGKWYEIPVTIYAYSKSGKAGFSIESDYKDFEYTVENVQVNAKPANIPSWWQRLGTDITLFVVGVVVGIIASIIFALIKKIISLK